MHLDIAGRPHLSYCTNIHPGETWPAIRRNIEDYVLPVRNKVAPGAAFGIGLRLSGRAANTLAEPGEIHTFQQFLTSHNLYVFTINGFPHGRFHGTRVKENVYLPDWLEEERLRYADQLAHILASLLPDHPTIDGSISSVPGSFKPRAQSGEAVSRIAGQLLRHAATLHRLYKETGRIIACALEPEPCCLLETTRETVFFFKEHLFSAAAIRKFSQLTGLSRTRAEESLRRHLGVCLDACHAAVEFEDPDDLLSRFRQADIRIMKIQLGAGLRIPVVDGTVLKTLEPFAESTYLHQVVERNGSELTRYQDLPLALRAASEPSKTGTDNREWRIHFHVPLFVNRLGPFENTQPFVTRLLRLQKEETPTTHLEVETYTWDVLPEEYRGMPVVDAVARELQWVIESLER